MRKTLASLASFVCIWVPLLADAQTFESVGIRAQGMGGAFVAVADDAMATWWNPAGLATGAYFNALIEYDRARAPEEVSAKAVAVAFPSLGLSYYRLPINQMQAQPSTGTTAERRQDQGVLSAYGATVGQSIGSHFVVASTVKLVRAGETRGDLDVGAMATLGVVRAGLTVKNVRRPSFAMEQRTLTLEREWRAGIAASGRTAGALTAYSVALDADLRRTTTALGDVRHVAGGLEVWAAGNRIGLRGGLSANSVGAKGSSRSGGASLMLQSGAYVKTYLDAQITGGSDETRRGWGVGLRIAF